MPWKEPELADIRHELLERLRAGERPTDLAREYDVSRKTIYKFKSRLEQGGRRALEDMSRRPKRLARRLDPAIEQAVLALKTEYPTWGAKKIRARLPVVYKGMHVPAISTIHQMLVRNGCVKKRKKRQATSIATGSLTHPERPNHVWGMDFKGQFRTQDQHYCYPLTATDLRSRGLLLCEALPSTAEEAAIEACIELFRQWGLPDVIRSDNGVPFSSNARWGLSRMGVLWLRLGILPERITPGCPQENGSHERMHRTLKAETTRPAGRNLLHQQEKFDTFCQIFNHERPHEALAMQVPFDVYRPSSRALPQRLPELNYPLADDTVKIGPTGRLQIIPKHNFYLTMPLAGELVGIQEQNDGTWLVGFAHYDLGIYDPSQREFRAFSTLRRSSLGANQ